MTLHKAIEQLIKQTGPLTTTEIANRLNENKWYQKKDGSKITPFQIHGRTKNYPHLFNRDGVIVSLKEQLQMPENLKQAIPKPQTKLSDISGDTTLLEKILMNNKNFKSISRIDSLVPDNPGIYCIRINDIGKLPKPFNNLLKERGHNVIYIGLASQSLKKRFLNQELRAKGHGTFFRSIGAVLGYKPPIGSLSLKANKRNYTFTLNDEKKIIEWINKNLQINWVEFNGELDQIETGIIQKHLPLLNLAKNPSALTQLSELRAECVRIANS